MIRKLPKIPWKGKIYTFDYRLSELRQIQQGKYPRFIHLNNIENERLQYAIETHNKSLIYSNMRNLEWKF